MADTSSDVTYDYCCNACEEDNVNKEALFYCQQCSKGFCDKCIDNHKKLFKKHQPFGRKELNKWPVAKAAIDLLLNCQQHPDHRIELFCEDHKKLCCVLCLLHDHKQCNKIVQTAEKAKKMNKSDVQRLADTIVVEQHKLKNEIDTANECLQKLQEAYDRARTEIQIFRKKISDLLDQLERNTVQTLDTLLCKLREAIKTDIEKCSKLTEDFTSIQKTIKHVDCGRPNVQIFISNSKSTEMVLNVHTLLSKLSANRTVNINFRCNPDMEQFLSGLSDLGNVEGLNRGSEVCLSGEIVKCKEIMLYSVKLASDQKTCSITGICELPNGELIVVDNTNQNVKLLDMQFNVVANTVLQHSPSDMCSISPNEVAIASESGRTIQFLTVNNRHIVLGRTLQFKHDCHGIAHYKGSVFVTSGTTLCQYTLDGQLVKNIYEDTLYLNTEMDQASQPKKASSEPHPAAVAPIVPVPRPQEPEPTLLGATGYTPTSPSKGSTDGYQPKTPKSQPKTSTSAENATTAPSTPARFNVGEKVHTFAAGEKARVTNSLQNLKMLQNESCGWNEMMEKVVGQVGTVEEVDEDGDVVVAFDGDNTWTLNPEALTPCSDSDAESSLKQVYKCAVSPDGSRLYVTSHDHSKLFTLSTDGTVLSSLEDPTLRGPTGVHVSETRQLFVCGWGSHNVVQVDGKGGVVTLASKEDGLDRPESVYYSASSGSLIVGQSSDNILVFNSK
ncbi:uncharacterized protein LOC127882163 [Dreissena polymorpha]|uniref:B box-type domain-containing protein n=1 Tax=Dreissena polymorpha TaxID=45954 RepID=A0A9D4H005_DREPO|nr:uncharacterized protein LOC127882163 [Dreissena polymorpha]KAH3826794.1 hypothetical protein DPMN_128706 [Dreissena polymorpha]